MRVTSKIIRKKIRKKPMLYENQKDALFVEEGQTEVITLTFPEEYVGKRIDTAISALIKSLSRSRVQSLIADGNVEFVNSDVKLTKNYKIQKGDIINITVTEQVPLDVTPENLPIKIVYEDDDVIVVDKDRGMVVHPAHGNETGTLVNALLYHCKLSSINGTTRPGIVHRIDKNTSGLLVVAKNDIAHGKLSEQLAAHSMTRKYIAIVNGGFSHADGTITEPIGRHPKDRKKQAVIAGGRKAVTHYRVIEKLGNYTLVELQLETGRTHQIRVHMNYTGHSVLGDDLYGSAKGDGQYLHAKTLGFVHPKTSEYMEFESEIPEYFSKKLTHLQKIKK